ncbi:MAG: SDR family NAD(P)-dependent oxidoreductase [Chloroflexi bacterium]|nr:SDR family NAD(P)-dependent oxidoreductase [Chloroflexota bacterium]
MAQTLKGKSAVVTGGGSGIGRGIALALAAEGAKVVVNDIGRGADGRSAADRVVEEIVRANGAAVASHDSVATMAGGENIIKTATTNFGRIDILVNTAGNYLGAPVAETTEEMWDSLVAVHLKGHFSCTRAAVREMLPQKSGRIINFSSRGAFFLPFPSSPYATVKAGIMGFTAALAKELKEHGITVNCILPSAVTPLFPDKKGPLGDNMPVPPNPDPEFVAPMVVYLATDEARTITGQYFYAGGGDLCIYARPLQLPGGAHVLVRKTGKWTLDELKDVVPQVLGLSF